MEQDQELARIILKSVVTALTQEEQGLLTQYLQAAEANREKYRQLTSGEALTPKLARYAQRNQRQEANFKEILNRINSTPMRVANRVHFLRRWGWAAAVALVLLVAGAVYFWPRQQQQGQLANVSHIDVAPGKNGAVLTLADGSQLVLDSVNNGLIAAQQGAQVVMRNGQLSYNPVNKTGGHIAYNIMTTPKGRQFNLVLPDGSKVWLNAASSLKYPTAFTGRERAVELTGEAYFEIAKNAAQPFKVSVPGRAAIEVLGTHFNVNAYTDEATINATLLQGSIRLRGNASETPVVLQPGQQGQLQPAAPINIHNADIDKVMAWKNGIFNFNDASLQEVMRQLARWYDIEVVYEKGVPDKYFYGKVSRDLPLSGLLKVLEATGVHFRIEQGRKLVVMP